MEELKMNSRYGGSYNGNGSNNNNNNWVTAAIIGVPLLGIGTIGCLAGAYLLTKIPFKLPSFLTRQPATQPAPQPGYHQPTGTKEQGKTPTDEFTPTPFHTPEPDMQVCMPYMVIAEKDLNGNGGDNYTFLEQRILEDLGIVLFPNSAKPETILLNPNEGAENNIIIQIGDHYVLGQSPTDPIIINDPKYTGPASLILGTVPQSEVLDLQDLTMGENEIGWYTPSCLDDSLRHNNNNTLYGLAELIAEHAVGEHITPDKVAGWFEGARIFSIAPNPYNDSYTDVPALTIIYSEESKKNPLEIRVQSADALKDITDYIGYTH
jgi:hypothetical protein